MNRIVNIGQLNQLMDNTYVYAACVALIAVLISIIISWMIAWQGTPDKSYVKRRIWYAIVLAVSVFGFWLYNDLVVAPEIQNAGWRQMFEACNLKCMLITILGNIGLSAILMCCFRKSKFASIIFTIKA